MAALMLLTGCTGTGMGSEEKSLKWWQKTIAYEIYVSSFKDSDGDGYGDLNGIREELGYLQQLGVGAIWLTPVYDSPMVDNGYDVADYYSINPRFGTMEDMDALIKEADAKGIKVVMDLVFNHTSDQCEWFLESSKSKDNPYADWYIWRDAKADGSEPNNWRGIFGGSAWTWSEMRQQYYLHTFASAQPDLNWANPDVRNALFDVANFWLDKGVGGFRMDAIPYIKKPADFSDGPADDADGMVSIHDMTANTSGILDYLHEFKDKVTAGKDVFTVGEVNGIGPDQLKDWIGDAGVFDMLFEFGHISLGFHGAEIWCKEEPWTIKDLKQALSASQEATASNGWYPIFFENHDKPRSINHYFGDDANPVLSGKALATVLLTLRGTPFLYQGEEIGMTNVRWPQIEDYDDISSHSQYEIALENGFSEEKAMECIYRYSRDNARTPMQWSDEENAGFTTGTPWLPVNENYPLINTKLEETQKDSVLSWYRKLVSIRKKHPVLIDGSYTEILQENEEIYAYIREDNTEKLAILVNFSKEEQHFDAIPDQDILFSSYTASGDAKPSPGTLRPYEALILRLHVK